MNLLLDSHAVLWWLAGDPLLPAATEAIADPVNDVVVSAATIWEIAIKRSLGKLRFSGSIAGHVSDAGFRLIGMSADHAEAAAALAPHHRDPFDRILVAQAQHERLTLVTRDPAMAAYDVRRLAC